MNCRLLECEATRANHIAVGKDAYMISALKQRLRYVPEGADAGLLTVVLDSLLHCSLKCTVLIIE